MEIREFAERILFGTTLDDKLVDPSGLTDNEPGPVLARSPRMPGRPHALRLDLPRERVPFPGVHELDREGMRGRVLHFFANHELLATELMALALLRFPDAPPSFRRGLVHTIEEEQRHLRMYHQRMQEDGVELGEIPVSSYFWDALSPMERPLDFVTGMSLTLEQANLDYASFYAEAFRTAGDEATARVLDIVYEEEIGHVKHGVVWFDRWRDPEVAPFDAYRDLLPPPLSPARARGLSFDADGRRRAGLDPDFIRRIEVYGDSRGRPPGLWLFNPSCDHRWIHGDGHPLPSAAAAIEQDIETLPLVLVRTDDVVVVRKEPEPTFLQPLARAGFPLPRFLATEDGATPDAPHRHFSRFDPWGWSPDAERRLEPLAERLVDRSLWPPPAQAARAANRKSLSSGVLRKMLADLADERCSPEDSVGRVCTSVADTMRHVDDWLAGGQPCVIKADHGSSGRGLLRILGPADRATAPRWLANVFRAQPAVVVEPWLDRVADLSVCGHVQPDGDVRISGITRFLTDARGQYRGSVVGRPWFGLDTDIVRFCHGEGRDPRFSARTLHDAASRAAAALHEAGYHGPFGVDALVHRDNGSLRLRPVVEINARWTMGHIALGLDARLAGGTQGLWLLVRLRDIDDRERFPHRLRELLPLRIKGHGTARCIRSGALFTTDPGAATTVLSVLVAGRDHDALIEALREAGAGPGLRAWWPQAAR